MFSDARNGGHSLRFTPRTNYELQSCITNEAAKTTFPFLTKINSASPQSRAPCADSAASTVNRAPNSIARAHSSTLAVMELRIVWRAICVELEAFTKWNGK